MKGVINDSRNGSRGGGRTDNGGAGGNEVIYTIHFKANGEEKRVGLKLMQLIGNIQKERKNESGQSV